ncbi:MAG TPA: caspase family protein, partial [Kofleriaceae bacterium]|nr:caspase family protein [Kofleriaceae bacterium]
EQIAATLKDFEFQVDLRTAPDDASRAGILEGYERLIRSVQDDEPAVFYYSGHGVRVRPSNGPVAAAPGTPRAIQALVPTDFDRSAPDDFRGILDLELSLLLARLTRRTRNATVILDCCHAAAMSRDLARPKALRHPSDVDVATHLARVQAQGFEADLLAATGNPHAIRLAATGQSASAFERQVGDRYVGTFTESLVTALREARSQRLTWDMMGRSVRERVLAIHPTQRADIEGPRRRYLFEIEEAPRSGAISVVGGSAPNTGVLRAGHLHGIHDGDQYAIVPNGAEPNPAHRIAIATVTKLEATEAAVALQLVPPTTVLPAGAQAVLTRSAAPRRAIRLIAGGAAREAIAKAIDATNRFTITNDEGATALLATVKLEADKLELLSPSGVPVVPASKWPGDSIERLVSNLRMLTAAQALRELESESAQLPDTAIEVAWGRVERGEPVELLTSGELLPVGARLFLRVTNCHPRKKRLHVAVFDIGVAQRIQLLTRSWPAGYELAHGETFTLGEDASGKLVGLELGWSSAIPEDTVRSESIIVVVTERPCDLSALETPGAKSAWLSGSTRSGFTEGRLQQLVRQFQYGTTRDLVVGGDVEGHLVRHISFELSPWRLPPRGKSFLLDDRPPESTLVFRPRGLAPFSRKIAIRITELVIHNTHALFGAADVRVDTLVITRSTTEGVEPYRAATARFKGIKDNERLPLDNALIFHGDVTDFVDLRIWVSRDRDDSKTLAELVKEQANSAEFKQAAGALLAVTALSVAVPAVAAVGAVATLTAIAWNVLSAALPRSIGLYQTSLLAAEGAGFGVGRHPPAGALRVQDLSFSYEVVAVE